MDEHPDSTGITMNDESLEPMRSATLKTASTVLTLQRRADDELHHAKQALEARTKELGNALSNLTATLESIVDGIIALDRSGNIITFNSKFVALWQFPDEVLRRRDSQEMMAFTAKQANDPQAFLQLIKERQSHPEIESFDVIEMKEGRIFERYSFPHMVNQKCAGVVITYREVTGRKQMEADLRLSEEKYRLLWATAGDAFILFDSDDVILEANAALATIFGYQPAEVIGQNFVLLQPERMREAHRRGVQRYLQSGVRTLDWRATEVTGLHRDGHEIPLEIAFNHLRMEGKDLFAGFMRDITTRKQAERTLAVFAAIVDSSHDAIVSKTLEGIITSWNRGAEVLFGYSAAEAIGKPILMIIPAERAEEESEILARQAAGERIDHFETVRIKKDGQLINVSLTLSPIMDSEGKVVGVSKIARDITERKQAEAEREALLEREQQARLKAEAADRTKDEFLATLSHELRTPLNAILGWASMICDKRLGEEDREQGLETIRRNALLQAQLVDDILDVSRIVTGKLRLDVHPLELSTVIENAVESVLPAAQAKGIRLQRVLDSGSNLVSGDPGRLQQVVWNLLSNAIKFTPKGGRVQIRLERINSHVEIVVADTGAGIDAETLPFVFDRFRQADQSSTRNYGGLGLGLAIVRHILEAHGGSVEADSAGENRGSIFTVKLPLMAVRSPEATPQIEERVHPTSINVATASALHLENPPELRGLHVLVVDDDADARLLVKSVLETCDVRVTIATSAAEALATLQYSRPDILLSDVGMPGEDGYSLIRKVRALPAALGGQTPAAALTAYARVEDRLKVLRSGFQIHLPKPIEPAELIAVVANLAKRPGH